MAACSGDVATTSKEQSLQASPQQNTPKVLFSEGFFVLQFNDVVHELVAAGGGTAHGSIHGALTSCVATHI